MTTTAVKEFLAKASEDEALQGELVEAIQAEDDREAVLNLAKSKGYEFTGEELMQEIQSQQAVFEKRRETGELTDDELEAVAGGELVAVTSIYLISMVGAMAGGTAGGIALANATKW